jgi:hypothetical protein
MIDKEQKGHGKIRYISRRRFLHQCTAVSAAGFFMGISGVSAEKPNEAKGQQQEKGNGSESRIGLALGAGGAASKEKLKRELDAMLSV